MCADFGHGRWGKFVLSPHVLRYLTAAELDAARMEGERKWQAALAQARAGVEAKRAAKGNSAKAASGINAPEVAAAAAPATRVCGPDAVPGRCPTEECGADVATLSPRLWRAFDAAEWGKHSLCHCECPPLFPRLCQLCGGR